MKLKLIGRCFAGLIMAMIIMGCFTTQNQGSQRSNDQMRLLNPPDVVGRKLIGSNENNSYSFLLNQNGTLEYTVNDTLYNGTWSFNESAEMYRYSFDWIEGDKKQGYIMDFLASGPKITVAGYWYLTDVYLTFERKVTFEE